MKQEPFDGTGPFVQLDRTGFPQQSSDGVHVLLDGSQDAGRLSPMNDGKHLIYGFFRLPTGSINFDGVGKCSRGL